MLFRCFPLLLSLCRVVQFGECVINSLGTVVVVVVVVAVVVELYADIHKESFHTHALLGAYALEC